MYECRIDAELRYSFHTEQWVPYDVGRVFAFFADPRNLPKLMPHWQKARIEEARLVAPPVRTLVWGGDAADFAGAGSEMTISFRPVPMAPLRMTWEAKIVEFEWDEHFCDEQPSGPFKYWRHCHRIAEERQDEVSGSLVKDDLVYELPLGLVGDLAQRVAVGRQVKAIFAYRQKRLPELLGAEAVGSPTSGR